MAMATPATPLVVGPGLDGSRRVIEHIELEFVVDTATTSVDKEVLAFAAEQLSEEEQQAWKLLGTWARVRCETRIAQYEEAA